MIFSARRFPIRRTEFSLRFPQKGDSSVSLLGDVLKAVSLTPRHAGTLRGMMGPPPWPHVCGIRPAPIASVRKPQVLQGGAWAAPPLNAELKQAAPRWIRTLRGISERAALTHGPMPVAAYFDADGCGHLGACLLSGGRRLVFSTHVPDWMRAIAFDIYEFERRFDICEFEMRASFLASPCVRKWRRAAWPFVAATTGGVADAR